MRYLKYYILGGVVAIIAIVIFWGKYDFTLQPPTANKSGNAKPSAAPIVPNENPTDQNASLSTTRKPPQPTNSVNEIKEFPTADSVSLQIQYCPQPGDLIKKGFKWTTEDGKWENYTPSAGTKILGFLGAQWIGIKVGKIICLYQTNEAVSFPVALEQTRSQLVLEPRGFAWSALVGNRKFCKSASVIDCSYFFEPPQDIKNIYKEIEYAPRKE